MLGQEHQFDDAALIHSQAFGSLVIYIHAFIFCG